MPYHSSGQPAFLNHAGISLVSIQPGRRKWSDSEKSQRIHYWSLYSQIRERVFTTYVKRENGYLIAWVTGREHAKFWRDTFSLESDPAILREAKKFMNM